MPESGVQRSHFIGNSKRQNLCVALGLQRCRNRSGEKRHTEGCITNQVQVHRAHAIALWLNGGPTDWLNDQRVERSSADFQIIHSGMLYSLKLSLCICKG